MVEFDRKLVVKCPRFMDPLGYSNGFQPCFFLETPMTFLNSSLKHYIEDKFLQTSYHQPCGISMDFSIFRVAEKVAAFFWNVWI